MVTKTNARSATIAFHVVGVPPCDLVATVRAVQDALEATRR